MEIAGVLGDDDEEEEEIEIEDIIYVSPIFTGRSAVGATVTVTLIGADGAPIASSRSPPDRTATGRWS